MIERRIAELKHMWRRTRESDDDCRARICLDFDKLFKTRALWDDKHRESYAYAIKHNIVKRIRPAPSNLYQILETDSRIKQIAAARDNIHCNCANLPNGLAIEREAGEILRKSAAQKKPELPVADCAALAEHYIARVTGGYIE